MTGFLSTGFLSTGLFTEDHVLLNKNRMLKPDSPQMLPQQKQSNRLTKRKKGQAFGALSPQVAPTKELDQCCVCGLEGGIHQGQSEKVKG